jgi:arginine repressor
MKMVRAVGQLVVVTTAPGSAQAVGAAIDGMRTVNCMATIAGDDTVLVIPEEDPTDDAAQVAATLLENMSELTESRTIKWVKAVGHFVVVTTAEGGAQMVAAKLDNRSLPGVLATIAGDNTILVVTEAKETKLARNCALAITLAGTEET